MIGAWELVLVILLLDLCLPLACQRFLPAVIKQRQKKRSAVRDIGVNAAGGGGSGSGSGTDSKPTEAKASDVAVAAPVPFGSHWAQLGPHSSQNQKDRQALAQVAIQIMKTGAYVCGGLAAM